MTDPYIQEIRRTLRQIQEKLDKMERLLKRINDTLDTVDRTTKDLER